MLEDKLATESLLYVCMCVCVWADLSLSLLEGFKDAFLLFLSAGDSFLI